VVENGLRIDQPVALNGRLVPAQQTERNEGEAVYRVQDRKMTGMADCTAMRGVITGMRWVERDGLCEGSPD
jgi:hypothetical protein